MRKRVGKGRRVVEAGARRVDPTVIEAAKRHGAERLGLVLVDPHKTELRMKVVNYFGELLHGPATYGQSAAGMRALCEDIQSAVSRMGLGGVVAGVELAGRNHRRVKRALQRRDWPVRMIHPLATSHLRRPASPGEKSDDMDLLAMERALRDGYGFAEAELPPVHLELLELSRARGELVAMASAERCRFLERLQELMPGYGGLFPDIWESPGPLRLLELSTCPSQLRLWSEADFRKALAGLGTAMRGDTIARVMAWAADAPDADAPAASHRRRILLDSLGRIRRLDAEAASYEPPLCWLLVRTRAVLLLGAQGVGVVSAATYAAELGPVENYLSPKHISGRAGLRPSRRQSGGSDRPDGPMPKSGNLRLRGALMTIALGLHLHNDHFRAWAAARPGWDTKQVWASLANRFARISHRILAEGMPYRHPSGQGCEAVLPKLLAFASGHGLKEEEAFDLAREAVGQMPPEALPMEIAAFEDKATMRRKLYRRRPSKELLAQIAELLKTAAGGAKMKGNENDVGISRVD